ncbi:hypothetical protein D3C72_1376860 [compost metagenome]
MKAKKKYSTPPSTEARPAICSVRDEVTRWNTSCCGMEPSIIVNSAAAKPMICTRSSDGRNSNFPAAAACDTTAVTPPACPLTS